MPLATEMECAPGGSSSPTASPAPAIAESDPVQKIRSKNVPRWKDTNIKLYYSPLACSLADHIALLEAGAPFEGERVDARTKQTASGGVFNKVTRKGYVPALVLDRRNPYRKHRSRLARVAISDARRSRKTWPHAPSGSAGFHLDRNTPQLQADVARRQRRSKEQARATISTLLDDLTNGLEGDYLLARSPRSPISICS